MIGLGFQGRRAVAILVFFAIAPACAAASCVSEAGLSMEASRTLYLQSNVAGAASVGRQSAQGLSECLERHPDERTISSEQRLEEVWLLTGNRSWTREHPGTRDEAWFKREVAPKLDAFTLAEIGAATGLSLTACSRIRAGARIPHLRQWEALRKLAES